MNRRTRWLLAGMALVGIILFGDKAYRHFVEEPAEQFERKLAKIEKDMSAADDAIMASSDAKEQLEEYKTRSLPGDEEFARSRYQDWLLSLVQKIELKQASVDSGPAVSVTTKDRETRKPREVYKKYSFTLHGRGGLQQVVHLLYEFYGSGQLHKIQSMSLTPIDNGREIDVTVAIEALAITQCARMAELSTVGADRLASHDIQDYYAIVRRNFFSRDASAQLRQLVLTAITYDMRGVPEAWVTMADGQQTRKCQRGDNMIVPPHEIQIIDIQPETALIQVDGVAAMLPLGKSVYDVLQ
ncbi:MAG: hypothetical protein R3E01_30820 [Pirellulaceae bacterium]|nr:hypothetical protein [Planctomycetales bacterium]